MKVILDTSVFVRDFRMDSPSFRTFLSQHAGAGHQFIMLEIVRDELLNKYQEVLYEQKRKIDNGIDEIKLKTGKNLPVPLSDDVIIQMCDEYALALQERLEQVNAVNFNYPSVAHKKVVERALQRKKPFDSEGQRGYRDALIWESILELMSGESDTVGFISQNPKDFADKNQSLHPTLLDEISALGNNSRIIYFKDLESFVSAEIEPHLKMVDDLMAQLTGEGYKGFDLITFTLGGLYEFIKYEELKPVDIDLPHSFEVLQVGSIEDVDEIRNVVTHSLAGSDLLISYEANISAGFTFLIDNHEYMYIHDDLLEKIEVWDSDWNDYYRLCHVALDDIVIIIKLILNQENATVQSAELVNISLEE